MLLIYKCDQVLNVNKYITYLEAYDDIETFLLINF